MKRLFSFLILALACASANAGYPWAPGQQLTSTDLNAAFLARCTYGLGALPQYSVLLGNGNGDVRAIASVGLSGQVLISGGAGITPAFAALSVAQIVNRITTQATSTYTVLVTDSSLIANYAGTLTYTLPAAASYSGRTITLRTITAHTVVSATSNVVPLVGGAAGTAILAATAGKWADLQSDGTNWQIMRGN